MVCSIKLYVLLPLHLSVTYCPAVCIMQLRMHGHCMDHEQRTSLKLNTHVTQHVYYTKRDYIWGEIIILLVKCLKKNYFIASTLIFLDVRLGHTYLLLLLSKLAQPEKLSHDKTFRSCIILE